MLEVDIKNILPVTDARAKIATLVDEVMGGKLYVLTRGGSPAVVVMPVDMAEKALVKRSPQGELVVTKPTRYMPVKVEAKDELPVVASQKIEESLPVVEEKKIETPIEYSVPEKPVIKEKVENVIVANTDDIPQLPQSGSNDDDVPAIDIDKVNKAIEEAEERL
ncbi:MAG: hypothetical protein ACD_58C00134G0005 [uncultured bacterium]|nr:MAG: hypothetical protein ACD_58C00134G0005 [uncultured bacterium]